MKGIIKTLIKEKGFGFITPEGEAKDLFFHSNDMANKGIFDSLQGGEAVTFELDTTGPKGPSAKNVEVVS